MIPLAAPVFSLPKPQAAAVGVLAGRKGAQLDGSELVQ
jgi:hypothetical protein